MIVAYHPELFSIIEDDVTSTNGGISQIQAERNEPIQNEKKHPVTKTKKDTGTLPHSKVLKTERQEEGVKNGQT